LNIERKSLSTQKKPTSFPSLRAGIYQSTPSKKYDDKEMENKGGWNFSLFFRNWNVDSRKSLVSFILKAA
jgi:hypothetical protein